MTREAVFGRTSLLLMTASVLAVGVSSAGLAGPVPDLRFPALAVASLAWLTFGWPLPLSTAFDLQPGTVRRAAVHWGLWTTAQGVVFFAGDLRGPPGWLLFALGVVLLAVGARTLARPSSAA